MIPHRVNRAIHNYFYIDVNWTWRTAPGGWRYGERMSFLSVPMISAKIINFNMYRYCMKIKFTSVYVNDQGKALEFYTETLGFVKKADITAGNYRWLTVASPEEPDGRSWFLEPNENPAAKAYQEALYSGWVFVQHYSSWMIFRKSMTG